MSGDNSDFNLEDIARLSGVSRSTVSRVVNQHPHVSERTRRHVLEVIEKYQYHPNMAARALATQKSNVIGILIPHIVHDVFSDPFFPVLLQSITSTANQLDYGVTLWLTSTEDNERLLNRVLNNRLVDGLIVASAAVDEDFLRRLEDRTRPFLLVSHPNYQTNGVSYVDVENLVGTRLMVQHLIARGRRRIGIIPGRHGLTSTQDRLAGYRAMLGEAGLPEFIGPSGNFSETGGYQAMKVMLAQKLDAVFCSSDVMAIGAMKAIKEAGLCIPDDIAVAGFDDIPIAAAATPSLTTVRQSITQLGEVATQGIIGILEGRENTPYQRILPVQLVIRQST